MHWLCKRPVTVEDRKWRLDWKTHLEFAAEGVGHKDGLLISRNGVTGRRHGPRFGIWFLVD